MRTAAVFHVTHVDGKATTLHRLLGVAVTRTFAAEEDRPCQRALGIRTPTPAEAARVARWEEEEER